MYDFVIVNEYLIVDTDNDVLQSLRPYLFKDLIRLGGYQDGGYVVPEAYLHGVSVFINFGVGENFDFEFFLHRKFSPDKVYSYDNLISFKYFCFFAIKGIVKFSLMKMSLSSCFNRFCTLLKYSLFYVLRTNVKLFKTKINQFNVDFILQSLPCNSALKVDIEGDEYKLLNAIVDNQSKFNFIIIEFHAVQLNETSIIDFSQKLGDSFVVAHLSLNNRMSNVDDFPQTMEVTYVKAASESLDYVRKLPNLKVDWHFPKRPVYVLEYF